MAAAAAASAPLLLSLLLPPPPPPTVWTMHVTAVEPSGIRRSAACFRKAAGAVERVDGGGIEGGGGRRAAGVFGVPVGVAAAVAGAAAALQLLQQVLHKVGVCPSSSALAAVTVEHGKEVGHADVGGSGLVVKVGDLVHVLHVRAAALHGRDPILQPRRNS